MPKWETDGPNQRFAYTAEAAISAYQVVKEGAADGGVAVCTATDQPLGVAPLDIAWGVKGPVQLWGIARGRVTGAVTRGHFVGPAAAGKATSIGATIDNTEKVLGMALEAAAADNDVISVLLRQGTGPAA